MSNYRQIWKVALLPVIDFIMIVFGAGLVYLIRYSWFDASFDGNKRIFGADYLWYSIFFAVITVSVYAILGVYTIRTRLTWWQVVLRLFLGTLITSSLLINYLFFNEYNRQILSNGIPVSRFILGVGGLSIIYTVLAGRLLLIGLYGVLNLLGFGKENVVLLGSNRSYKSIKARLFERYKLRAFVGQIFEYDKLDENTLEILEAQIKDHKVGQIFLLDKNTYNELELKLVKLCETYKVSFLFIPTISDIYNIYGTTQVRVEDQLFLELKYTKLDGWWVVVKRLFDIVFALSFLIVFSWVYLIIAIALLIQNDSPVFYLSERVGPDGKTFNVWKFARMKREFNVTSGNTQALLVEQELISKLNIKKDDGPLYKVGNDPRNTVIGRFIEKTSLDELPQFFNVLQGNMSVVGPRPHQPREVAKYKPTDYKVLNIKPGITGLAQINGRSDLSFKEEVELDTYYIENWTFWLDLTIIINTPIVMIFKRHKS
jgi:exopolysaccharide biosynthesis polyprenyl glycosylphosphotransferase